MGGTQQTNKMAKQSSVLEPQINQGSKDGRKPTNKQTNKMANQSVAIFDKH
jgi:hypothetical protein